MYIVGETMFYGKGAGSLATGSAVVSDLLNVALQFEYDLHTLPPHFELKTDETKEMMDDEDTVTIKEKSNFYLVINSNNQDLNKIEADIKQALPLHKSLEVQQRTDDTVSVVVLGIDESPEQLIANAGFDVNKVYPVEGV